MKIKASSLLFLLRLVAANGSGDVPGFTTCFDEINADFKWPVNEQSSTCSNFNAVFGPIMSWCSDSYKWNRGMGISGTRGDEIVASYRGIVKSVGFHDESGVLIEHKFKNGKTCLFHGNEVDTWYTVYTHVENIDEKLVEGATIEAGQRIGTMGLCGSCEHDGKHPGPSLAQEVRVGDWCAIGHDCNNLGVDPHVSPMHIYPKTDAPFTVTGVDSSQSAETKFSVTTSDCGTRVNKYVLRCDDMNAGETKSFHIDLNHRMGYETGGDFLTEQDMAVPYLDPKKFGHNSDTWEIDVVLPVSWSRSLFGGNGSMRCNTHKCSIDVYDVWGTHVGDASLIGNELCDEEGQSGGEPGDIAPAEADKEGTSIAGANDCGACGAEKLLVSGSSVGARRRLRALENLDLQPFFLRGNDRALARTEETCTDARSCDSTDFAGYSVQFLERYYDPVKDKTEFAYQVDSQEKSAISHITFGWIGECCIESFNWENPKTSETGGTHTDTVLWGEDKTTCFAGIKEETGYGEGDDERSRVYTMVVNGNVSEADTPYALKPSNGFCHGVTRGPDCSSCSYTPNESS